MRKVIGYAGATIMAAAFCAAFPAYFMRKLDPVFHVWRDGWGRELESAPWVMRFAFGVDHEWAGPGWFAGDMLIFWGGLALGFQLVRYGFKLS